MGSLGLILIFIALRLQNTLRTAVETGGVLFVCFGLAGALYHILILQAFLCLVIFLLGILFLWDPLHLGNATSHRFVKLLGYLFFNTAIILAACFLTNFPAVLWLVPFVIYLLPHLIPSLKKSAALVFAITWLLIFCYVGILGYRICQMWPFADLHINNLVQHERTLQSAEPNDAINPEAAPVRAVANTSAEQNPSLPILALPEDEAACQQLEQSCDVIKKKCQDLRQTAEK